MALTKVSGPLLHGSNDNLGNYVINNITGAAATFSSVSVGGTLTYDDVTNVDSVGIVTARGGLHVGVGGTIIHALSEDDGSVGIGTTVMGAGGRSLTLAGTTNATITIRSGTNNNGNIYFADGTTGSAQYMGMIEYNQQHNRMSFHTNGDTSNPKLRIMSDGKVGIGTDDPTDILDVFSVTDPTIRSRSGLSTVGANIEICGGSSNDSQLILSSGTTAKYQFFRDGSQSDDLRIYDGANSLDIIRYRHGGYLHFGVNGEERLRISSTGNVSIGNNATPDTLLHLQGDKPKLRIESTNKLEASAGTEEIGRVEFEASKGSNINVAASLRVRQDGTWSTVDDWFSPTAIEFYTQDQSGTEITTPRLTINRDGKIGIGITTPTGIFDIREDNNPQLTIRSTSHADDGGGRINFAVGVAAAPVDGNTMCSIASTIHSTSGGTLKGDMKFYTNGGDTLVERLRITSNGQLCLTSDTNSVDSTPPINGFNAHYETDQGQVTLGTYSSGGTTHMAFYTNQSGNAMTQKMCLKGDGSLGLGIDTPTAGDLATGDSQNSPLFHVKGTTATSSDTGGEYNLLGRFEAGGDANSTGAMIVLNHSNDRGLALIGGREQENRAYGAIKVIDNIGRLSDGIIIEGGNGAGIGTMKFFTGEAATTTERLHIDSLGRVGINTNTHPDSSSALSITNGSSSSDHCILDIRCDDNETSRIYFSERSTEGNGSIRYTYTSDGNYMGFYTNGKNATNERLRIDSGGTSTFDVGAPSSSNKVIGRFQAQSTRQLDIVWHDSGSLMGFNTPQNHNYIFKINDAEKFRLTSDSDSSSKIIINNPDTSLGQDQLIGGFEWKKNDGSGSGIGTVGSIKVHSDDSYGARAYMSFKIRANSTGEANIDSEFVRLTSGGRLRVRCEDMGNDPGDNNRGVLIGDTSSGCVFSNGSSTGFANNLIFMNGNGVVGKIETNGSSTNYNESSSDRTLKKNFENWTEEVLPIFKNLNPQKFNFLPEDDSVEKTKGFIAQDLTEHFPRAYPLDPLTGKYNYNPGGMVVYLMKALQEEIVKREALEARISALEGS